VKVASRKGRFMAASRSNTPSLHIRSPHPHPHPKSTLTIEEWEAKAPLGDAEIKSIAAIKIASERRPDLQPSTVRVCSLYGSEMTSEIVGSPYKNIMSQFHARQLPNNASNTVQAHVLPPQVRVHWQPQRLPRMPFIPSNPSKPQNNSTTGSL